LLSFAPLFNEIQLFGIKMKKEIKDTKKELEEKIQNIQNTLMAVNQSQTINFPSPSSESVLNTILQRLSEATTLPQQVATIDSIPDVNSRLFSYRFQIEQETKRILETRLEYQPQRYVSLLKMFDALKKSGLLEGNVFMGIREIVAICNNAIHGEGLSQSQIEFADAMAPRIIATLKGL
jgi:hypothetical protein